MLSTEEIDVGPLYVDALRDAGKIDKSEFSFMMAGMDTDYSALDIGAPLGSRIDGGLGGLVEVPMFDDFFWS